MQFFFIEAIISHFFRHLTETSMINAVKLAILSLDIFSKLSPTHSEKNLFFYSMDLTRSRSLVETTSKS